MRAPLNNDIEFICPECIGEKTLSNRMVKMRPKFDDANKCDIHPRRKGIPLSEVAEIVDEVVRNNYGWGEFEPVPRMDDDRVDHVQEGETLDFLLQDLLEADLNVVAAIKRWLFENDNYWPPDGEEAFYAEDQNYVQIDEDGHAFSVLWREFRRVIQHEQRFFNSTGFELLKEIFDGIHTLSRADKDRAIYMAGPDESLNRVFRTRHADTEQEQQKIVVSPHSELAAPPALSRKPGRMNPSGIAALYCALEIETCVAEMRPPVGGTLIGTAMEIIRPICVLDLTKFEGPPRPLSMFDRRYSKMSSQWAFMQSFRHEISRPVLPNDEHLEYVPTQVVAEFLAHHHDVYIKGEMRKIDAILFSSAQRPGGTNIVFLGDATAVEQPDQEAPKKRSSGISSKTLASTR